MSATIQDIAAVPPLTSAERSQSRIQRFAERVENSDGLSSLLAIFDQGMISGTNFLTAIVIGRCCGADTLGLYALIASAIALLLGVQEQLITAPYVMYHGRKGPKGLRRYTGSIILHQCLFTALAFLTFGGFILNGGVQMSLFKPVALTLVMAFPAILFRGFVREVALAHCRVLTVVMIDATVCVTQLVVLASLFATDSVSLVFVYAAMGGTCLLTSLIWLRQNRSAVTFSRTGTTVHWLRNWRFGRWALATHVAGTSTPYIMPWVLFMMHGEAATGFLASCSVIVGIANILMSGMSDFLTPRAAAAYAEGGLHGLRRILRVMALFSALAIGIVCVVSLFFGEQIITILYDGKFPGAGELVVLLTFAVLANALGNVAGNGLWALNQPRANFVADLIALTTAISAALIFVKPHGPKGAAIAILVASVMGAAARIGIFQRHLMSRAESGKKN